MRAAHTFKPSSVDETVPGDLGQTILASGEQPLWADIPVFCVTSRCCRRTGAARTINSVGQGSGVYVLPERAAIADNAGLAPKILLVL